MGWLHCCRYWSSDDIIKQADLVLTSIWKERPCAGQRLTLSSTQLVYKFVVFSFKKDPEQKRMEASQVQQQMFTLLP
jgi:hypothetical protein